MAFPLAHFKGTCLLHCSRRGEAFGPGIGLVFGLNSYCEKSGSLWVKSQWDFGSSYCDVLMSLVFFCSERRELSLCLQTWDLVSHLLLWHPWWQEISAASKNWCREMHCSLVTKDTTVEHIFGTHLQFPKPLGGSVRVVFVSKENSTKPLAAAAKSLQSCPTLCDPIDGSQPGSPVPGILQARTLEWAAISFSNARKWKVKVKSLSRVQLLATPAYQAPPPMGFSRQEYWSGVPLPSPQNLLGNC